MFEGRSREHKVLMSDGITKKIRTNGGAEEARRIASATGSGIAVDSIQTQKYDDANNLSEGGGNY